VTEKDFARVILNWFDAHKRGLPWRDTRDPYLIWLSEIIMQQTRVAQGLSYYHDFVKAFPNVFALARANERKVLRLWEGLGYYSRARNLHRCARIVAGNMNGVFPASYHGLLELPGVGLYTAAAIASIAFDERVPVLDGNVFRVMARIFGIQADISAPASRKTFIDRTMRLMPATRPGDFNQALMEFGALQCVPRNPDCDVCPLASICVARKSNSVGLLPVKGKKPKVRSRHFNYFVIQSKGRVGMRRRNGNDIWKGLYDFYLVETDSPVTPSKALRKDKLLRSAGVKSAVEAGKMQHQLTHQKLYITFIAVTPEKENPAKFSTVSDPVAFYSMAQAEKLPKPVPVKLFIEQMKKGRKRN
jgi:A/G-specific adenine glycosylase